MALKDWKKVEPEFGELERYVYTKKENVYLTIGIPKRYYTEQGYNFFVYLWNYWGNEAHFKTKQEAVRFAKKYMREN
jgi:hypothetical protein